MIVKTVAAVLLCCFCVLILKKTNSEIATVLSVLCGVIVCIFCFSSAKEFLAYFINLVRTNSYGDYFTVMLKALGIGIISSVGADICRDCNENTLAGRIELAGKIEILLIALPLLKSLIELSEELLIE